MLTVVTDEGERTYADGALDADAVASIVGWELKPEGLCRGDECVPYRGDADLEAVAAALRRPVATEQLPDGHTVAVVGASTVDRAATASSRRAPSFSLPSLTGDGTVSLDDHDGHKRLLLAWASW
jgi:hypothetical protein